MDVETFHEAIGRTEISIEILNPRCRLSVKSDNPMCPGSWTCRKMTSRSSPRMARHERMRRSSVRRMPAPSSG